MRRNGTIAVGAAILLFATLGGVSAGPPAPIFARSPAEGPPGTEITASGSSCTSPVPPPAFITVGLYPIGGNTAIAQATDVIDFPQEMSWEVTLTVPSGASSGQYELRARCQSTIITTEPPLITDFAPQPFTVTGGGSSAGPSGPADPVEGEVAFTG